MVKTNTKGLCKNTIDNIKNYLPVGSYLMLSSKPVVPGSRPLISIGCKYHTRKVLYCVFIEDIGSTNAGLPYLSN